MSMLSFNSVMCRISLRRDKCSLANLIYSERRTSIYGHGDRETFAIYFIRHKATQLINRCTRLAMWQIAFIYAWRINVERLKISVNDCAETADYYQMRRLFLNFYLRLSGKVESPLARLNNCDKCATAAELKHWNNAMLMRKNGWAKHSITKIMLRCKSTMHIYQLPIT